MGAGAEAAQRRSGWGFSFRERQNVKLALQQSMGEMVVLRPSQDLPCPELSAQGRDRAPGDVGRALAPLLVSRGALALTFLFCTKLLLKVLNLTGSLSGFSEMMPLKQWSGQGPAQ